MKEAPQPFAIFTPRRTGKSTELFGMVSAEKPDEHETALVFSPLPNLAEFGEPLLVGSLK